MNESFHENSEYEAAELVVASRPDRTRIARRWVFAVFVVQAVMLVVLLETRTIGFLLPSGPIWVPLWIGWHCVWRAASVAWPTSVIVGPLTITAACLAGGESPRRTVLCVAVSIVLTGLPWAAIVAAFGRGAGFTDN